MGEQTPPPPPGWYPDPSGSGHRYWDGAQWGATAPKPTSSGKTASTAKRLIVGMVGTTAGILLAIFIVLVYVLHACGSAYEDLKKDPAADAPTVNLGANFNVGGLAISNMNEKFGDDLGGDGFTDTKAKGVYVVITAHVTNNGTKSHGLNSEFQKLHIGAKEYQADPFANIGSSLKTDTSVYVDPGFSDDVMFIFDVPKSSVTLGTTGAFTEKAVLTVSGGLNGEQPNDVNVVL